jgi:hypothetical protein
VRIQVLVFLMLFASCFLSAQTISDVTYSVSEVNCGIGPRGCLAYSINERGHISGTAIGGPFLPMLWAQGNVQVLGSNLVGGAGLALNDRDEVVGESILGAFLWRDGGLVDMGVGACSTASDINNAGEVIGGVGDCNSPLKPFLWKDGILTHLSPDNFNAEAISNRGDIAGCLYTPGTNQTDLALWRDGTIRDLGSLPGCNVWPGAMNDRSQIVANFRDATDPQIQRSVLWDGNTITILQPLPGDDSTQVFSINDRGEIAGISYSFQSQSPGHPVIWRDLVPIDLNQLVPETLQPLFGSLVVENNRGQVVVNTGLSGNKFAGPVYLLTSGQVRTDN